MTNTLFFINRFKNLNAFLVSNSQLFEGKATLVEALATLQSRLYRIEELHNSLLVPITALTRDKNQQASVHLRNGRQLTKALSSAGEESANQLLIQKMSSYRREFNRSNLAQQLALMAEIRALCTDQTERLAARGFDQAWLTAFDTRQATLQAIATQLQQVRSLRAANRREIVSLHKEVNYILAYNFDPFMAIVDDSQPLLVESYRNLRRLNRRKPSTGTAVVETNLSGTVTDSLTGEPVNEAVVRSTDNFYETTSDADGYYLLDELEAGPLLVTCEADGYTPATPVEVTLANGDRPTLNFSLVPLPTAAI
ncbi:MAG: carboxypeptidase-like regulatory domain-containing protein [Bacteroidales bacterium]|nr:carboxypeptidase-like regulatory domain-containing protein [Bacteroidales bacterium]